jgi:hypothetical protein
MRHHKPYHKFVGCCTVAIGRPRTTPGASAWWGSLPQVISHMNPLPVSMLGWRLDMNTQLDIVLLRL